MTRDDNHQSLPWNDGIVSLCCAPPPKETEGNQSWNILVWMTRERRTINANLKDNECVSHIHGWLNIAFKTGCVIFTSQIKLIVYGGYAVCPLGYIFTKVLPSQI